MQMRRVWALASVGLLACAPTAEIDSEETGENLRGLNPPTVAFDPTNSVIPVPNTLGLVDTTTLRLDIPATADETPGEALIRTTILNDMNGWPAATPQPIEIPLTAPVNVDSAAQAVLMINLGTRAQVMVTPVAGGDSDAPNLTLVPQGSLEEGSTYAVVVLKGLATADGTAYEASAFWNLVRQEENPVDLEFAEDGDAVGMDTSGNTVRFNVLRNDTPFDPALPEEASTLLGLNTLWAYHNLPLAEGSPAFLPGLVTALAAQGTSLERTDILQAFFFTTQSSSIVFNPAVPNSPAANIVGAAPELIAPLDLLDGDPLNGFPTGGENVDAAICGASGAMPGCGACDLDPMDGLGVGQLPCFAVAKSSVVQFASNDYGTPAQWDDTYFPTPGDPALTLTALYFEPAGTAPDAGWPVVIFGHGLGRSKSDVVSIVPTLNAAGYAVIAIDWPLHGTPSAASLGRAVINPTEAERPECIGTPEFTAEPSCYLPFLSANLGATRDGIRQGIVDVQQMVDMLKFCTDNTCEGVIPDTTLLDVDGARIGYIGQSLGGIIGSSVAGVEDDIQAAVLNVAAVDWLSILENSQTEAIVCPLIQALVALSVVDPEGVTCGEAFGTPGEIDASTWNTQPGYIGFTFVARWILEAADGLILAQALAGDNAPAVLLQEVDGDTVIPNAATAILGGLLGTTPVAANVNTGTPVPTPGVTNMTGDGPGDSPLWIDYTSGGGNDFNHGSLLSPAAGATGLGGTVQMQTDAITFFLFNL